MEPHRINSFAMPFAMYCIEVVFIVSLRHFLTCLTSKVCAKALSRVLSSFPSPASLKMIGQKKFWVYIKMA
jgi:hypothetical protein